MTIEHLVAQSLIGTDGFTDALVGQCGNLILVPEELNDKLADKSFTQKKAILAEADLNRRVYAWRARPVE